MLAGHLEGGGVGSKGCQQKDLPRLGGKRLLFRVRNEIRKSIGYGMALAWPSPLDLGLRFSSMLGDFVGA